jgi:hypothetical protein
MENVPPSKPDVNIGWKRLSELSNIDSITEHESDILNVHSFMFNENNPKDDFCILII